MGLYLFTVFTIRSAWPLYWSKCGLLVTCLNPNSVEKVLNSKDENWGPLSEIYTTKGRDRFH